MAFSHDCREALGYESLTPGAGALTFVPFVLSDAVPPGVSAHPCLGGTMISVTDDPFSSKNPQHLERARQVAELLAKYELN